MAQNHTSSLVSCILWSLIFTSVTMESNEGVSQFLQKKSVPEDKNQSISLSVRPTLTERISLENAILSSKFQGSITTKRKMFSLCLTWGIGYNWRFGRGTGSRIWIRSGNHSRFQLISCVMETRTENFSLNAMIGIRMESEFLCHPGVFLFEHIASWICPF